MDAKIFAQILSDKAVTDLRKLEYKYGKAAVEDAVRLFPTAVCEELPLQDFHGSPLVYMEPLIRIQMSAHRLLMGSKGYPEGYGLKAMEDEIHSTMAIESIHSSRQSIR